MNERDERSCLRFPVCVGRNTVRLRRCAELSLHAVGSSFCRSPPSPCKNHMLRINLTAYFPCTQAGAEISTVNPEQYSKRFYDFITTILS